MSSCKTLEKIARSQTEECRKVQRAKIILYSAEGMSNTEITCTIGIHHNTAANFVNKYIAAGFEYAMNSSEGVCPTSMALLTLLDLLHAWF